MANEGADIIQPDVTIVGGLWEMKKIAAMAEAEYVVVPHHPCGPVANAVNMLFALSTTNFLILGYHPDDEPSRVELVDAPIIPLVDGHLIPPDRPGLGLDLNLQERKKHAYKPWHRPFQWKMDENPGYW